MIKITERNTSASNTSIVKIIFIIVCLTVLLVLFWAINPDNTQGKQSYYSTDKNYITKSSRRITYQSDAVVNTLTTNKNHIPRVAVAAVISPEKTRQQYADQLKLVAKGVNKQAELVQCQI